MKNVRLVLGSGGARGMAHIGVIEELEKEISFRETAEYLARDDTIFAADVITTYPNKTSYCSEELSAYYPSGTYLFDRDSHTFELMLNYSYFVDLTLATNVYNDDNYSTYVQIAKEIDGLTLFVGGVVSESDWYGTKEPAIIEVGASATKGDFSVSYVLNPNEKKNYITLIYSL